MLMVLMADPLGNIPITISCMKNVPNKRRTFVLFRECMIAMGMLLLAMFFGRPFLAAIGLSDAALSIGGSVIVMLMAIRMVFPTQEGVFGQTPGGEPYIVPIAIPAIAGPSTLATIMMLAASEPNRLFSGRSSAKCVKSASLTGKCRRFAYPIVSTGAALKSAFRLSFKCEAVRGIRAARFYFYSEQQRLHRVRP